MAPREIYLVKKDPQSYLRLLEHFATNPKDCQNRVKIYRALRLRIVNSGKS